MTTLLIKDLSLARRLDRAAARAVRGGILIMPVEPDGGIGGPGIAPGGCMPLPWPMPALPGLPALPGWGWCGTPAPSGPGGPVMVPQTDRMAIR